MPNLPLLNIIHEITYLFVRITWNILHICNWFIFISFEKHTHHQQLTSHVSDNLWTSMLPISQTSLSKCNSLQLEQIFDTDGGNETQICVTYSFGVTCHSFDSLIYTSNHLVCWIRSSLFPIRKGEISKLSIPSICLPCVVVVTCWKIECVNIS